MTASGRELRVDAAGDSIYEDGRYLATHASWHVEDSAWKAGHIRAMLERNSVAPQTVCEVGCGAGEILHQLSMAMPSTRFIGYELSPQALALCAARASDRVTFHRRNLADEEVCFDCLLCIDVFEHVDDYIGFLKGIRGKAQFQVFHIPMDLNALGLLRNAMMTARRRDGHLHYFTRDTALATLEHSGYEIRDWFYTPSFRAYAHRPAYLAREALFRLAPDTTVRLLGGCSLMVLTC